MHDIFLSYSTKDRARLQPLFQALAQQGWSVFWDHQSIHTGDNWHRKIDQAIRESRCVVVVWSKSSIDSEWVLEEASRGKSRNVLLPIRIDAIEPPFGFGMRQAGDFTDWNGKGDHRAFIELAAQIYGLLGRGVQPPPPPPPPKLPWLPILFISVAALGGGYYWQHAGESLAGQALTAERAAPVVVDPAQTQVEAERRAKSAQANEVAQAKATLEANDATAWPDAVTRLSTLAESGNTAAMQVLGMSYYVGQGIDKDQQKACQLYKQAADAGDTKAKETYANLPNCH
jgi:hypothetical protein